MRILLIEDEPDLLSIIAKTLCEARFSVDEALDGESGLRLALATEYDAIVLDVMLPGLDGWEVLRKLRSASKRTPVLLLTARDGVEDRVRGLNSGADDYLTKPFELTELIARVRALIRRSAGQASAVVQLGEIEVDTAGASVRRNGKEVELTAKEYALLELLVLHRGKLVSRTTIYNHIYDAQDDSLSNVVDVYISNLRRKLGADLIQTRRGQGYTIRD